MPTWKRDEAPNVQGFILARYGNAPHNVALDGQGRLTLLELPKVKPAEFNRFMEELKSKFPEAF